MINPFSTVYKIDENLCFFGLKPQEQEVDLLKDFLVTISKKSPKGSNVKVNYFKDGDNILGEALVKTSKGLNIARSVKTNIPEVSEDLDQQIKKILIGNI